MAWVKTDDRYDDTRKIKRAWRRHPPNPVGLHAMAKSYCARHETDGLVDLDWLEDKIPDEEQRAAVLATMVEVELFEHLAAGEKKTIRVRDIRVQHGPLNEDAYIVHDYLEYNEARSEAELRRRKEAERKAAARAKRSGVSPPGQPPDSDGSPEGIQEVSALSRPDPTRPDPTESTMPPSPPNGGRKRERDRFEQQMEAWVTRHLPDHPVKAAIGLVQFAMQSKGAGTVEEIVAYVHQQRPVGVEA